MKASPKFGGEAFRRAGIARAGIAEAWAEAPVRQTYPIESSSSETAREVDSLDHGDA